MIRFWIILSIIVGCILCGCEKQRHYTAADKQSYSAMDSGFSVIEITVRGKTHEYIHHPGHGGRTVCHFPDCKYCSAE